MPKYAWCIKLNGDNYSFPHNTIDECLNEAKMEPGNAKQKIYVGECVFFTPQIDMPYIFDYLEEQAYDEDGEHCGDWRAFDPKKPQEYENLEKAVNDLVVGWLKDNGYYPSFFTVENVIECEV